MRKRLTRILIRFAVTIAIVLVIGGIISLYTDMLSEEKQQEVLIKAMPFVAVFVSIVLAFICLIVIAAVTLEGKVPLRTYRPIEFLLIAGILIGVAGLFQGWKMFVYEFGFLVVLFSLLAFMIWSHVTPMPLRQGRAMPPLSRTAHLIGTAAAVLVWAAVTVYAINDNKPQEPYGLSKTLWDYKSDEEKVQIKSDADSEYRNAKIPVTALMSLLPAGLVYFGVREIAAARQPCPDIPSVAAGVPLG
jgi:lysylphosphatidylglycerol synthetase-like protein (DUF2156 family)